MAFVTRRAMALIIRKQETFIVSRPTHGERKGPKESGRRSAGKDKQDELPTRELKDRKKAK